MAGIVEGLFGLNVQDLQQQQNENDAMFSRSVASVYKRPSAKLGALVGANIGQGLARGLFNIQDPRIQRATQIEQLLAEAQQESQSVGQAEAMKNLSKKLSANGFGKEALLVSQQANALGMEQQKFQQETDLNAQRLANEKLKFEDAQRDLTNNKNAQDALQGYITAAQVAGAEPTASGVIEAIGQYMPPEKLANLLQTSEDKAAYRDAMIRQAETAAISRVEAAKAKGASQQELEAIKQQNRIELKNIAPASSGKSAKTSAQERTIGNTMTTAMNEASIAVNNLSRLTNQGQKPMTSSLFYTIYPNGVFDSVAKSLNNTTTEDERALYESVMTPLVRQVVTIQSGGRYKITEGAVKQEVQAIVAQAGQSHATMLAKMAELKQTINASAEASLASGTLNPKQEGIVRRGIEEIDKAIPWSFNDVSDFVAGGGNTKFKDFLSSRKKGQPAKVDMSGLPAASSVAKGTIAKNGNIRLRSNGKTWEEVK